MNGQNGDKIQLTPPSYSSDSAADVLQRIIADMSHFSDTDRQRLLSTVATFFGLQSATDVLGSRSQANEIRSTARNEFRFSADAQMPSIKDFFLAKDPQTDVEKVAVLAYYLSKFRQTPHFKTSDITALNVDAAHRAFSNTAFAVENATKSGYLVPSVKGAKQLSAAGEQFVDALPDRVAAKAAIDRMKPRRTVSTIKRNAARQKSS